MTRGAEGDFAKAVALQDWFRTSGGFRYSLEQRSGSGMDLLAAFVTNDRVGYCEQFAAAMAAMGRVLGIPSRVVVGFLDGEHPGRRPDPLHQRRPARVAGDVLHRGGLGALRADTRARGGRDAVLDPAVRGGRRPRRTRPSAAPASSRRRGPTTRPVDTKADDDQGLPIPAWPLTTLLVLLVLGLVPALVRVILRRRRLSSADPVHLAEGAWAELRATALDLGLDWPEQRSPREQARSVVDQVPAEDEDARVAGGAAGPGGAGTLRTGCAGAGRRGGHPRPGAALAHGGDGRVVAQGDDRQRGAGARLARPDLADVAGAEKR